MGGQMTHIRGSQTSVGEPLVPDDAQRRVAVPIDAHNAQASTKRKGPSSLIYEFGLPSKINDDGSFSFGPDPESLLLQQTAGIPI
jgi:hypothetical protein